MSNYESDDDRMQMALAQLRSETVPAQAQGAAFDAVVAWKRRRKRVPIVATVGVAGVCIAALLWPARKAMAWQQVVQSTLGTTKLHEADFFAGRNGQGKLKFSEEWYDGGKYAYRYNTSLGGSDKGATGDTRYDGKRRYLLSWTGFGEVYDSPPQRRLHDPTQKYSLTGLLKDARIHLDKDPTEVEIDGKKALRYSAKVTEGPPESIYYSHVLFYAEPQGGRIVRTEELGPKGEVTEYSVVDYPERMPNSAFTPPTNGTLVFDLDRDAKILNEQMSKGVPIGHGNVLRAVVQSPTGELVVLWTGSPPNGNSMQQLAVIGHPAHGVLGPDQLTVSRWKINPNARYLFNHELLCGLGLQLDKPVGAWVTLRVPILVSDPNAPIRNSKGAIVGYRSKQVGAATVKDFPVIHTIPFSVLEFLRGNLQT